MMGNIIRDIEKAYGSLERPDWSFVAKRMKAGVYEDLVKKLAEVGSVQETTDQNYDNSRCLFITSGDQALTLRLSLVGYFACIHATDGRVLSGSKVLTNALGEKLAELLKANSVELLDEEMLRTEIDFGGGKCSVYEALFSSDEMIP
jgi:hypothetical protein